MEMCLSVCSLNFEQSCTQIKCLYVKKCSLRDMLTTLTLYICIILYFSEARMELNNSDFGYIYSEAHLLMLDLNINTT